MAMATAMAATATATVFFLTVPVPLATTRLTVTAAATHLMSTMSAPTTTNFPFSMVHGIEHIHHYDVVQATHLVINAVVPQSADNWPSFLLSFLLRTVTTPIKNFLSRAKTSLSSFLPSLPSCRMSLNCHGILRLHESKLSSALPSRTSLNCHDTSGCMTLNCPPLHSALSVNPSRAYGPRDCLTIRTDSTTSCASIQNPCPDLDPSSSTDSLQTHDSLITPESLPHLPSPIGSLEEGSMNNSASMAQVTQDTQVGSTQVGTDSLAYDSLVTALSRLSLEPRPKPLSDPHRIISDPYWISIMTPHPLHPDLDPIGRCPCSTFVMHPT